MEWGTRKTNLLKIFTSQLRCIHDNGHWSPKIKHPFTCFAQRFAKLRTIESKLTRTFHWSEVEMKQRTTKILKRIFVWANLVFREEKKENEFWVVFSYVFGVRFFLLYRNQRKLFGCNRCNPSEQTYLFGWNGHNLSGQTHPSPNRHPFAQNRLSWTDTFIRSEHEQSFWIDMSVCRKNKSICISFSIFTEEFTLFCPI